MYQNFFQRSQLLLDIISNSHLRDCLQKWNIRYVLDLSFLYPREEA